MYCPWCAEDLRIDSNKHREAKCDMLHTVTCAECFTAASWLPNGDLHSWASPESDHGAVIEASAF